MRRCIKSSAINGALHAPPSKSVMIRAVAASLLAEGVSTIKNPSFCLDSMASLNIARSLGARIEKEDGIIRIEGNAALKEKKIGEKTLNCGESGLCMRMFVPISGLTDKEIVLSGVGTLLSRPVAMVEELTKAGAYCSTNNGYPPVRLKGPVRSGRFELNGSESSQFLTGLLMALPLCSGDSEIVVTGLKSRPYIIMTIETMRDFGVHCEYDSGLKRFYIYGSQRYLARDYSIEGDWSGGSFLLVAGAIAGSITVYGLNIESSQADRAILDVLRQAGAYLKVDDHRIMVEKRPLQAFTFDASDSPDLVPPLVPLAACCDGKSVISGIERLRYKESNRLDALIVEFSRMGLDIKIKDGSLEITGGGLKGAIINPRNDHRIAMATSIGALTADGELSIENTECVAKSYPSFFDDLDSIMVER